MRFFIAALLWMFIFHTTAIAQNNESFWMPVTIPPYEEHYSVISNYQVAINTKDVIVLVVNYANGKSLIYRSADKAKTWKAVPSIVPLQKEVMPGMKMEWTVSQLIAVDSVFLAVALLRNMGHLTHDNNNLVRSFDGGKSWKIIDDTLSHATVLLPRQNGDFFRTEFSRGSLPENVGAFRWLAKGSQYGSKFTKIYESACDTSVIVYNGVETISIEGIPNASADFLKTRNAFWTRKGTSIVQMAEGSPWYFPERCAWFRDPRNPDDIEFLSFEQLFTQQGSKNALYAPGRENGILKSADGGKNWQDVTNGSLRHLYQLFPIPCSGNLYIAGHSMTQPEPPKLSIQDHLKNMSANKQPEFLNTSFRSKDGGKSWEELKGLSSDILDWDYAKDGTIYVCTKKGVYKSREKECAIGAGQVEVPKPVYGTTVITHGTLFNSPVAITYQTKIEQLADTILAKAKNGAIWYYQVENGAFKKIKTLGQPDKEKGEQILIFDWVNENIKGPGYTGAAAEALYLALTKLNNTRFNLKNIHFIGHGRGCIVNTLVVEKLLQLQPAGSVSIDQVTHIGPYERSFDLNDEHPDIQAIAWPEATAPNNGIIAWEGHYTDAYWQDNGIMIAYPMAKFIAPELIKQFALNFYKAFPETSQKGLQYAASMRKLETLADDIGKGSAGNDDSALWKMLADAVQDFLQNIDDDDLKALGKTLNYLSKVFDVMDLYEEIMNSNFDSRPVQGAENFKYAEFKGKKVMDNSSFDPLFENIGIMDVYIESICNATFGTSDSKGGYSLSRLNGGQKYRNTGQGPNARKQPVKPFDYYVNLKYSNPDKNLQINRIRSIYNGSFDRVYSSDLVASPGSVFDLRQAAGWERIAQPGLEVTSWVPSPFESFDFIQEKLRMMHHPELNKEPIVIRHNRFYVPSTATHLSFIMACFELQKGEVDVIIKAINDASGENMVKKHFDVVETIDFKEQLIDISKLKGKIVTLEIRFGNTQRKLDSSSFPMLAIDEVQLRKDVALQAAPAPADLSPVKTVQTSNKSEALLRMTGGTTYFSNASLTFELQDQVLIHPESAENTTRISFPFVISSGGGGLEEIQVTWGQTIKVYSKALNQNGTAIITADIIEVKWESGGNGAISTRYHLRH